MKKNLNHQYLPQHMLTDKELSSLYDEDSVADYTPEKIEAFDLNNTRLEATVYNLPPASLSGQNKSYAHSLIAVARHVGLPDGYIDEIERWEH